MIQIFKVFKKPGIFISILVLFSIILGNIFFLNSGVNALSSGWDLNQSSEYTYDSDKISIEGGVAKLKSPANWYSENWGARKPISIDNTSNANTLTNYQISINIDYDSNMQADFDDIRFTDDDKTTLINHWRESYTSSTSATFWIKVPSIPASSTKTIYMYYANPLASDTSNETNTFIFADDFEYTKTSSWEYTVGNHSEHGIIKDNKLYTTADGIWVHDLDGNLIHHFVPNEGWFCSAPVIVGDYIYAWLYSGRLYKIHKETGAFSYIEGNGSDFEHLSHANYNGVDLVFIPQNAVIKAIKVSDMSVYWTSSVGFSGQWDGGLVVGNYLYTRQTTVGNIRLFKVNLSDGTTAASTDPLGSLGYYSVPVYDQDNNQILVTERTGSIIKAFSADTLGLNWTTNISDGASYLIMYSPSYHNNVIYAANKGDSKSYMYALNATNGNQIWKSSVAFTKGVTIGNTLITDNYIIAPTHDYLDHNYNKMIILKRSDGTLQQEIHQTGDTACSVPTMSGGKIFLGMWVDNRINALTLGSGESGDFLFKGNSYSTGYVGNKLTSFSPIDDSTMWANKWDIAGTTAVSGLANGYAMTRGVLNANSDNETGWKMYYSKSALSQTNYIIESNILINTTKATGYSAGLDIAKNSSNQYLRLFLDPVTDKIVIYRDWAAVVATVNTTINTGVNYKVRVHVAPTAINIDLHDGSSWQNSILTYATTPIAPDHVGMNQYKSDVDWDNYFVRQYSATPPTASLGAATLAFATDSPSVVANDSISFTSIESFTETATKNSGEIKYQLSNDNGDNWYYYNSGWQTTTSGAAESNTIAEINSQIETLPTGDKQLLFKAFFISNGAQQISLDSLEVQYLYDTSLPIISNVTEENIGVTSAKIIWTTDKNSTSQVVYGLDGNLNLSTEIFNSSSRTQSHSVDLSGLLPCQNYYYKAKSLDIYNNQAESDQGVFKTLGCEIIEIINNSDDNSNPIINISPINNQTNERKTLSENSREDKEDEKKYTTISFRIIDEFGNPISGAVVTILQKNLTEVANKQGIVEFGDIQLGQYDLEITFNGSSYKRKIEVTDNQKTPFEIILTRDNKETKNRVIYFSIAGILLIASISIYLLRQKK